MDPDVGLWKTEIAAQQIFLQRFIACNDKNQQTMSK